MSKRDPTKTLTLRKKAVSESNRHYNIIKQIITETLVANDALHLNVVAATADTFQFTTDVGKQKEFMDWLKDQINTEILQFETSGEPPRPAEHWLNTYIGTSYEKGAQDARRQFSGIVPGQLGQLPQTSVFALPAHRDTAEFLFERVYSELKGITDVMEQQISRILSDGLLQGLGPNEIARQLNNRVDAIGKARSKLLARTEVVHANNVANVKETQIAFEILGEEPKMIWITAGDENVRPTHEAREGNIYTPQEALALLGDPNCRCTVVPHVDPKALTKKQSEFSRI